MHDRHRRKHHHRQSSTLNPPQQLIIDEGLAPAVVQDVRSMTSNLSLSADKSSERRTSHRILLDRHPSEPFMPTFLPEDFVQNVRENEVKMKTELESAIFTVGGNIWWALAIVVAVVVLFSLSHVCFLILLSIRLDTDFGAEKMPWTLVLSPLLALAALCLFVGIMGIVASFYIMPRVKAWSNRLKSSSPSKDLLREIDVVLSRERAKLSKGVVNALFDALPTIDLSTWLLSSPMLHSLHEETLPQLIASLDQITERLNAVKRWVNAQRSEDNHSRETEEGRSEEQYSGTASASDHSDQSEAEMANEAERLLEAASLLCREEGESGTETALRLYRASKDLRATLGALKKGKHGIKDEMKRRALNESMSVLFELVKGTSDANEAGDDDDEELILKEKESLLTAFAALGSSSDNEKWRATRRRFLKKISAEAARAGSKFIEKSVEDLTLIFENLQELTRKLSPEKQQSQEKTLVAEEMSTEEEEIVEMKRRRKKKKNKKQN